MAKGDDAVRRKKNKAQRKKLNRKSDSSTVSARVASIIAAKKRRKAGKRRICQGMCFSLPTPDDPFNERLDKKDVRRREPQKSKPSKLDRKVSAKRKDSVATKGSVLGHNAALKDEQKKSVSLINNMGKSRHIDSGKMEIQQDGKKVGLHGNQEQACKSSDFPSKYLILCLKAIEDTLYPDGTYNGEEGNRLFVNPWGIEFWKCYSAGKDILETSGSSSDFEQIAWIASTAADVISRREKEGHLFTGPFLLFIVPSKEKALKVRSLCKPLKAQGIHTVSLHPGASIDHQINGLQSCEPEFLVSTPERLLELVSLKAIDISVVSMLVIDGMESASGGCYLDTVKSVRQAISGKPHTLVFFNSFNNAYVPAVQSLLTGLVYRLSLNDSVASQSAGIIQSIHVCSSKEERTMKGIQALDNAYSNQIIARHLKVLYVVGKDNNIQKLVSAVKFKGYSISISSYLNSMESGNSLDCGGRMRPTVSIIDTENISCTDLGEYSVVIIPDFVLSIDDYLQILTRMARHTVNGVLHSFLTKDDSWHAGPLIEILEQCGQEVAEELRNL
ncbi:ATP-dependent RNA helicase DBP3 [Gossypium australe]|uniref:ATP-dependent RNA helicase DBP3 n=1 Tax=Gossypium australe TaxID=47621 RepID=A0A5B6WKI6_9ROSI|nr:ATP-dependent RNA helicase DBP3 [Gossypium australe]